MLLLTGYLAHAAESPKAACYHHSRVDRSINGLVRLAINKQFETSIGLKEKRSHFLVSGIFRIVFTNYKSWVKAKTLSKA